MNDLSNEGIFLWFARILKIVLSESGAVAHAKLCELKQTDPSFWNELTTKQSKEDVPAENIAQPEDVDKDIGHIDDSDVPLEVLVQQLAGRPNTKGGYIVNNGGGLVLNVLAEQFDKVVEAVEEKDGVDKEIGHGSDVNKPISFIMQSPSGCTVMRTLTTISRILKCYPVDSFSFL